MVSFDCDIMNVTQLFITTHVVVNHSPHLVELVTRVHTDDSIGIPLRQSSSE